MILSDVSVRRPVAMSCLIIGLTLLGFNAFRKMGLELMPKMDVPFITIVTMSVLNTIGMAVVERTTEIGTLRALGLKRPGVIRLFVVGSSTKLGGPDNQSVFKHAAFLEIADQRCDGLVGIPR